MGLIDPFLAAQRKGGFFLLPLLGRAGQRWGSERYRRSERRTRAEGDEEAGKQLFSLPLSLSPSLALVRRRRRALRWPLTGLSVQRARPAHPTARSIPPSAVVFTPPSSPLPAPLACLPVPAAPPASQPSGRDHLRSFTLNTEDRHSRIQPRTAARPVPVTPSPPPPLLPPFLSATVASGASSALPLSPRLPPPT